MDYSESGGIGFAGGTVVHMSAGLAIVWCYIFRKKKKLKKNQPACPFLFLELVCYGLVVFGQGSALEFTLMQSSPLT